jgi:hypothetical protein
VNPSFINWSTGDALPYLVQADGIHDTPQGAFLFGSGLAAIVNGLAPARDDRFVLLGDTYDATYNTTGNLLRAVNNGTVESFGLMAGSGGTLLNGATGSVPTGWFGDAKGLPVSFAQTSYDGHTNLTKSSMILNGTVSSAGLAAELFSLTFREWWSAGDTIIGEVEADWSIAAGINSIGLTVDAQDSSGNSLLQVLDGFDSGFGTWPTGPGIAVFRTNPLVIPAGAAFVNLHCCVYPAAGTVNAVVNWARASLRKKS